MTFLISDLLNVRFSQGLPSLIEKSRCKSETINVSFLKGGKFCHQGEMLIKSNLVCKGYGGPSPAKSNVHYLLVEEDQ